MNSCYEKIPAIPTEYNGVEFRSRLEARWAVFFDLMGIEWRYEFEGYDLGEDGGWYLPDFYLPEVWGENGEGQGIFCEIKPLVGMHDRRIFELAKQSGKKGVLLVGEPVKELYDIPGVWGYEAARAGSCWDNGHDFAICNFTGKVGVIFEGQHRWPRIGGFGDKSSTVSGFKTVHETAFKARMAQASILARKWRFH